MRSIVKRGIVGFLGVVASLALLLGSNSATVLADGEQTTQLVVQVNSQTIVENTVTRVTPGLVYRFSVYKAEDMTKPQEVEVSSIVDEQGNSVSSRIDADLTWTPVKEDAGKTLSVTFTTKEETPVSVKVLFKVNQVVTKISLSKKTHTMNMKEKLTLTATVSPKDAVNSQIIWKTSNAKVANVLNGVVTALSPGKCTITATLKDGSLAASCEVIVRTPAFNISSKSIAKGKGFTLKVLYLNNKVTWSSSNTKIATVKNGVVTAKKNGNVTITAVSGNYKMTCKVKVTNPTIVNSNNEGVVGISVTSGFKRALKVKGSSSKVSWTSSNAKIATVKDGVVNGNKTGSCYVYANVDGKTLKCKVTTKSNVFKTTPIKNGRRIKKGKVSLSNASMYYSKGKLIYKCYAVNSTSYQKVEKYNNISISIYVKNKLVAKQSYKNIKLNLKKYRSKALTFTFDSKNVKEIVDLRTSKITVKYNYDFQYFD